MTFQSERLVMIGNGFENHEQPHEQFPAVPDGNHLRWSFDPAIGFAQHGYYLFRREHIGDLIEPTRLAPHVAGNPGQIKSFPITTPRGTVTLKSGQGQPFVSNGTLAAEIGPGSLQVIFPEPVFEATVELTVGRYVRVRAVAGNVTVDEALLESDGTATLKFDRIEALVLEGGPATLTDVAFYPVTAEYNVGWTSIDGFDGPLGLPLAHPHYPATGMSSQDLPWARQTAADRIAYGDPSYYTTPGDVDDAGSVDVQSGSIIVTGTDTDWSADLAGRTFQVDGDQTAYVATEVRPGDGGDDELLLSRPYEGADGQGLGYTLADDHFGQLHDYLVHLVDEGPGEGGMLGRALPMPIESTGDVVLWSGSELAYSWNANWDERHEGLYVQFAVENDGTVSVVDGDRTVLRDPGSVANPMWTANLEGMAIQFGDQRSVYTVESVDTGDPNTLELDRDYAGPPLANTSFAIYEPMRYRIESVQNSGSDLLLDRPYAGPQQVTDYLITGAFGEQGVEATAPWQAPLETALLGSVDPAIAQALGLYWIDQSADREQSYDYLLVADHDGRVARHIGDHGRIDPATLEIIGDDAVDGYISFDIQKGAAPKLDPPDVSEVYELPASPPEAHTVNGETRYGTNTAGLRWNDGASARGAMLPDDPIQFHLWRHKFDGEAEPPSTGPPVEEYEPITAPLVAETDRDDPVMVSGTDTTELDGWPDQPIHSVDRGLLNGWYSYRVNGVDIFGRASELGDPAVWKDDGNTVHQSAIELIDDRAPPAPRQVDAEMLDVDQPVAGTGEARVSWIWPDEFQAQAPDAVEFQIHYYPGKLNDQFGAITAVSEPYDDVYEVETDVEPIDPATGYNGAMFHVGDASYEVRDSWAAADGTLTLEVTDQRPEPREELQTDQGTKSIQISEGSPNATKLAEKAEEALEDALRRDRPKAGRDCTVSIPPAYRSGTVNVTDGDRTVWGYGTDWSSALVDQSFTTPDGNTYTVEAVPADDELELDRPYEVPDPDASERTRFDYAIDHPVRIDFSRPDAWADAAEPADWRSAYATVDVDDFEEEVSAGDPDNPLDTGFRVYETTVPIPKVGDPPTDPFATSESEPVTYAHVGVNTYDRPGNPGEVSAPVTLTRVFEGTPEPPVQPSFESAVDYATAPDYDGQSKYTVRFAHPGENRRVHVYRAMDKALFRADWERRTAGNATRSLDPTETKLFPAYRRDDSTAERRTAIVSEIKSLHDAVEDLSDFADALPHYRDLEPDVLQTLAGLDGTESVYTQRTMDALDPDEHPNVKGPDFEEGDPGPGYQPGPDAPDVAVPGNELCAWVDSFDGKSRRRYFYRTGTVNEAGNRSDRLSYPTRPVQAVDTVPPTPPSPNGVEAGHHDDAEPDDRALTLRWDPSPERDTATYRVYHSTDRESSRDVRLMDEVAPVSQPSSGPVVWSDTDRRPDETHYYRITAVDGAGNESAASPVLSGKTFALQPPDPPSLTLEWVQVDEQGTVYSASASPPQGETFWPAVRVSWSAAGRSLRALVEHDAGSNGSFESVTGWLSEGVDEYVHEVETDAVSHTYRLRVQNEVGATNETFAPTTIAANTED